MASKDDANLGDLLLFNTGIIFGVIAGLAVALRFTSKLWTVGKVQSDDWWILAGLFLFWAEDIIQCWSTIAMSRAIQNEYVGFDYVHWIKVSYSSGIFYFPSALFAKISLLILYRRVFSVPSFRMASAIVMVVAILFYLSCMVTQTVLCVPIQRLWDPTIAGYCYPYGTFLVAAVSLEIGMDVAVLSLPIPMIVNLHLPTSKKITIACVFLLGGFVIITNIVRIILCYDPETKADIVWHDEFWLILHLATAILCACLPTYGPLLQKFATLPSTIRKRYASYSNKSSRDVPLEKFPSNSGSREPIHKYGRMDVYPQNNSHFAEAAKYRDENLMETKEVPATSIRVTDTVNVV